MNQTLFQKKDRFVSCFGLAVILHKEINHTSKYFLYLILNGFLVGD